jgi:O-antigen ligase
MRGLSNEKLKLLMICLMLLYINLIMLFDMFIGVPTKIAFTLSNAVGFLLFLRKGQYKDKDIKNSFIVFIALSALVFLNGIYFGHKTRFIYGVYENIFFVSMFFSLYTLLERKYLEELFGFIVSFGMLPAVISIYEYLSRTVVLDPNTKLLGVAIGDVFVIRGRAFFESFLTAAMFFCIMAILTVYFVLVNFRKSTRAFVLYLVHFIIYLIALLSTASRGPLVILFVCLCLIGAYYLVFIFGIKRIKAKVAIPIIAAAFIVFIIIMTIDVTAIDNYFIKNNIIRIRSIFQWQNEHSNSLRMKYWRTAINLIKNNFFTGIGIAATGARGLGSFSIGVTESGFLKKFVELGIVGIVLYGTLFYNVLKKGINTLKVESDLKNKLFMLILSTAFLSILLEDIILQITETVGVSFYLWFIAASILKIAHTKASEVK